MVAYAGHLQADGNIVIENNAVRPGGTSESAGGGGAYVDADSSCYFSNGVVISNNQAEYGGGFVVPNFGGSALQWNIMENGKFTNNIAFKNAGGALFFRSHHPDWSCLSRKYGATVGRWCRCGQYYGYHRELLFL